MGVRNFPKALRGTQKMIRKVKMRILTSAGQFTFLQIVPHQIMLYLLPFYVKQITFLLMGLSLHTRTQTGG